MSALALLVALVVAAWPLMGADGHGAAGNGDQPPPATPAAPPPSGPACPPDAPAPGPFTGRLSVEVDDVLRHGAPVTWRITVHNTGEEPVTLVFPTGQDADVVLLDPAGAVAHRWSAHRVFTQALRCETLAAGASRSVELAETSLEVAPGAYTLRATSAAAPAPPPVERPVTVAG